MVVLNNISSPNHLISSAATNCCSIFVSTSPVCCSGQIPKGKPSSTTRNRRSIRKNDMSVTVPISPEDNDDDDVTFKNRKKPVIRCLLCLT